MTRTAPLRKPRARSQARIDSILDAARTLLAAEGVASLSIYSVADKAQIPPSSVYHFFASVPALLEALTADVHAAFRACLLEPIDHERLSSWRDLSRLVEQRMLDIYGEDAAARQLILAQHGLTEVTQADRQHDIELGDLMHQAVRSSFRVADATRRCRRVRPGHGAGRSGVCPLRAAARADHPAHGRGRHARLRCLPGPVPAALPGQAPHPALNAGSGLTQQQPVDAVVRRLVDDQVGSLPSRQDVFNQVLQVDPVPGIGGH